MSLEKEFESIKLQVYRIIRKDKEAISHYQKLLLKYYEQQGYIKIIIPEEKITTIESPGTINRSFRKILQEYKKALTKGTIPEHLKFLHNEETITLLDKRGEIEEEYHQILRKGE